MAVIVGEVLFEKKRKLRSRSRSGSGPWSLRTNKHPTLHIASTVSVVQDPSHFEQTILTQPEVRHIIASSPVLSPSPRWRHPPPPHFSSLLPSDQSHHHPLQKLCPILFFHVLTSLKVCPVSASLTLFPDPNQS